MDWWWTVAALVAHLGPGEDDRWARVLTGLDLQRAQALAHADPSRLDAVYASKESAAEDRRIIDAYRERGGRVEGAVLRIDELDVIGTSDARVELAVTDRLGQVRVRWDDGSTTPLPRDRPTRRIVVLRLTDDGWRISESRLPEPQ